ncbi:MAG TPA: hypothetical protein VGX03_38575 [Candidatus Binatia bacterium]|jgi:tetratricopeptide (TPR) repeat protein|nr:hypothetical protein [Candidatus Binatia bacterium]
MAMKIARAGLALCAIAVLLYSPRLLFSCGPFFPSTIFTYTWHPDFPLDRFARGELGVLQPTYARSYLAVAYRYLSGVGLDNAAQQAVQALWQERLDLRWNADGQDWIQHWLDARNAVPGVSSPPQITIYRTAVTDGSFHSYLNCPDDAFRTAVSTLEKRIAQFGADSATVREWVTAQDQVFANCARGQTIPSPASPSLPALIQADRTYQIAAAHFYIGDYDAAKRMFAAISQDHSSPWRQTAPYLLARTLFRQAVLQPSPGSKEDRDLLAQAETQAEAVLNDSNLSEIHPAAQRLLNRVRLRLQPAEQLHSLAETIVQKNTGEALKQSLWDYTMLLDTLLGEGDVYDAAQKRAQLAQHFAAQAEIRSKDDITDWLLLFQGGGKAALEHALHKWSETASLPWLVASLAKTDGRQPQTPALLAAAEKVTPDSPAFPTVAFHRLRLLIETGDKEHAREQLDALLASTGSALPPSSHNLFLALRMPLSRSLDEWLSYAQRVPARIFYDEDGRELPGSDDNGGVLKELADGRTFFDTDATRTLNRSLPVSLLIEVAASEKLPLHLRRELALATWVRAAVLDDVESGQKLAPIVTNLIPALQQNLEASLTADSGEARKFAAVFLMLHFPGIRPYVGSGVSRLTPLEQIDGYRDNWWCSFTEPSELDTLNFLRFNRIPAITAGNDLGRTAASPAVSPDFLDQGPQKTAEKEWQRLTGLGAAPDYFARLVIDWAQKHKDDQRVPEALHLAVRATRYGCTDEQSSGFSKQAFQLLHRRYPDSSWAKKTPYWY